MVSATQERLVARRPGQVGGDIQLHRGLV